MNLIENLGTRIRAARWWLITQIFLMTVLIALSVVWLRISDKEVIQVALDIALPPLLLAVFVWLQTATMRALMAGERRVRFIFGAMTFIAWALLAWTALAIAWDFGDKIELYSGYLNSRFPPGLRARLFTASHIETGFNWIQWLVMWVVVPGIFIPLAALTSVTGAGLPKPAKLKFLANARWWIPILVAAVLVLFLCKSEFLKLALLAAVGLLPLAWTRIRSAWCNWRWWPVVFVAALIVDRLLPKLFAGEPHGSTNAQVWAVILKTAAYYLVIIAGWLLLLTWSAVLLNRFTEWSGGDIDDADDQMIPVLAGGPSPQKSSAGKVALE